MGGLPIHLGSLPTVNCWSPPRFYGMGGSPATWVVYRSKAAARNPDYVVQVVQPSLTGGLPIEISAKVVPSTFQISA
ncbi:hypothetical protein B296_00057694 [Ensete ventricosum]|uniref:Uncharacterized protein n=1 Tax=Ensete ventricosum TaxID=4639 RepID=A0A426WY29_ENSVE|nr:hypothetical protein B296_00057694 [Ensete ventricosum]